jgi:hypothetical protein
MRLNCRSVARCCLPGLPLLGVAARFLGSDGRRLVQRPVWQLPRRDPAGVGGCDVRCWLLAARAAIAAYDATGHSQGLVHAEADGI